MLAKLKTPPLLALLTEASAEFSSGLVVFL